MGVGVGGIGIRSRDPIWILEPILVPMTEDQQGMAALSRLFASLVAEVRQMAKQTRRNGLAAQLAKIA